MKTTTLQDEIFTEGKVIEYRNKKYSVVDVWFRSADNQTRVTVRLIKNGKVTNYETSYERRDLI